MKDLQLYCNSLTHYSRFVSREVKVGNIGIGGSNPIRIQSMITTDTMNTIATVEQSIRMIDAGCELVRITAPNLTEAKNLKVIKDELKKRGYDVPLIADIHYTPNAAEEAARLIEKVRVNPGNYVDKKKFQTIEYTDIEYNSEIDRIRTRFTPLVNICKEYGTAMRIGTNHGSLSDRILSRYGDTPFGMVESAMEFLRICEHENYHNIVLSMKASNTHIMVQAYRLLVKKMQEEGMNYPLHLGVTEAGEAEDGRIKSAVGIGALLEDGIGDTIRVSLTEEPELEIPVAKLLVDRYQTRHKQTAIPAIELPVNEYNPFEYTKRTPNEVVNIGAHHVPIVMADLSLKKEITPASFYALGYHYSVPTDKWNITDLACDYVFTGDTLVNFEIPGTLSVIYHYKTWLANKGERIYPFLSTKEYLEVTALHPQLNIIYCTLSDLTPQLIQQLKQDKTAVLLIDTDNEHGMAEQRRLFFELEKQDCKTPVIIGRAYGNLSVEELQLQAATDIGSLMIDGFGDGIFVAAENCGSLQSVNETAFGILQAARTRISKTEYISCPSCGRTLFDLQQTTAMIREQTSHLKGIKIGIMGCIVNGPGEMADADYGYVGVGKGKISLYKGQEVVKKNIPSENAVHELIELIKEGNDWVEV